MSIIGFGAGSATEARPEKKEQLGGEYGDVIQQSEELRDEKINQDLQLAFDHKQKGQHSEALELYLTVLRQDFIKNSSLEQHVIMKLNSHKNTGEICELQGNFPMAKAHYIQALRIKPKDSDVWMKVGRILYKHYADLEGAKSCFEASIHTRPTLLKRSVVICAALVYLAEINFKLSDYSRSEELTDMILARISAPNIEPYTKLFALKMKAFFYSIKGEFEKKEELLQQIREFTGKPDCGYNDLEVLREYFLRIEYNLLKRAGTGIPMYDPKSDHYEYLRPEGLIEAEDIAAFDKPVFIHIGQKKQAGWVDMEDEESTLQSQFNKVIKDLYEGVDTLISENEDRRVLKQKRIIVNSKLAANDAQEFMSKEGPAFIEAISKLHALNSTAGNEPVEEAKAPAEDIKEFSTGKAPTRSTKRQAPANQVQTSETKGGRRALRRKMDFTEQHLSQINLNSLDSFKDYMVEGFQSQMTKRGMNYDQEQKPLLEIIFSQAELIGSIRLIEDKEIFKRLNSTQLEFMGSDEAKTKNSTSQHLTYEDLGNFVRLLNFINGKKVQAAIRTVLRFSFDLCPKLVNSQNSIQLYHLFTKLMWLEGPFDTKSETRKREVWDFKIGFGKKLDLLSLSGGSLNVLLSLFEVQLLHGKITDEIKSWPLLEQRHLLFDFFDFNKDSLDHKISTGQVSLPSTVPPEEYRIRLIFAMMYCAFEVMSDMNRSVSFYQELQALIRELHQQGNRPSPVSLPWVAPDFALDQARMSEFGDFKIKQAKVFKDFNTGLISLKQREHQLGQASSSSEPPVVKPKPAEFNRYVHFYLDQFFLNLNQCVTIKQGEAAVDEDEAAEKQFEVEAQASCTSQVHNEEKAKEMWGKLMYALCRAESHVMFKTVQKIFCVFTAVSYLNKGIYEQFILKKLDFEQLFQAIHGRLQQEYTAIFDHFRGSLDKSVTLYDLKEFTEGRLRRLFKDDVPGLETLEEGMKLEVLILQLQFSLQRHTTPEFLHYNVFLMQASNTAFQNFMSSGSNAPGHPQPSGNPKAQSLNQPSPIIMTMFSQSFQQESFVNLFPQILYYFEFFKSILNSDPQKDNAYNLRRVLRLFIHVDRLAHQNMEKKDVFFRSYTLLIMHAFPMLVKCLRQDVERQKIQSLNESHQVAYFHQIEQSLEQKYSKIAITKESNLLSFVTQMLKFFFDVKLSLDHLDQEEDGEDEEMQQDEDESEEEGDEDLAYRRLAHLSCLLSQLKREKQSKFWIQQQQQQTKSPQSILRQHLLQQIPNKISTFADMIQVVCFLTDGRPLQFGKLSWKDAKTLQVFNDVVLEFFSSHLVPIQSQITSYPGNQLVKRLNKTQALSEPFSSDLLEASEFWTMQKGSNNKEDDGSPQKQPSKASTSQVFSTTMSAIAMQEVRLLISYIQSLVTHTVLVFSPFQIPRFDLGIRVCAPSQGANTQPAQAQGALQAGIKSTTANFYFASTRKGGALGNYPVQIAKMHETIYSLTLGKANTEKDLLGLTRLPHSSKSSSAFVQMRGLCFSSLKVMNKMIKLDLLHYFVANSQSTNGITSRCTTPLYKFLQTQEFYQTIFNVMYTQSLIHFQQFILLHGQNLFANLPAGKNAPAAGEKPGANDSDFRHWFLKSAIFRVIYSLRYLVEKQRMFLEASDEEREVLAQAQTPSPWAHLSFFDVALTAMHHLLAILLTRIKLKKLKLKIKTTAPNSAGEETIKRKKCENKIIYLKITAYLIASICDQLQLLKKMSEEKKLINQTETPSQTATCLLQRFLETMQSSFKSSQEWTSKNLMKAEQAQELLSVLPDYSPEVDIKGLDYQFLLIKAKYGKLLTETGWEQQRFDLLARALKIAQVNSSVNGVLECFRKILKGALTVGIYLRYEDSFPKEERKLNSRKALMQDIIKPILQDQELAKLICYASKMDQINQGSNQQFDINMDPSIDMEEPVILHDHNASKVRPKLLKAFTSSNSQEDDDDDELLEEEPPNQREENDLVQIYKMLDFIFNNLTDQTKLWTKAKFQLLSIRGLHEELLVWAQSQSTAADLPGSTAPQIQPSRVRLLAEIMKMTNSWLLTYDDVWNGMIYDNCEKKNLLTSLSHQELLGLTLFKFDCYRNYFDLCFQAKDYDLVKDIYKKKLHAYKHAESLTTNNPNLTQAQQAVVNANEYLGERMPMPHEVRLTFESSKNSYVAVLNAAVAHHSSRYLALRQAMSNASKLDKREKEALKVEYEAIRKEYMTTKEHVPALLREIFELFAEVHSKKGFLVTRKLISDQQRKEIVQAVILCCVLCGPEQLIGGSGGGKETKKASKVLDLARLHASDYQHTGLMIGIQWYLEVLDKQGMKKNQDFQKKLKQVMDDLKAKEAK